MKNWFSKLIVCLLAVAVVLAIVYKAVNCAPSSDLPLSEQASEIIDDGGCLDCHAENPNLPFYAGLPVIGKMVSADAAEAYRLFDMEPMTENIKAGNPLNEVSLAKVEKVVLDGNMPQAKYYLMHWGSSLTPKKRNVMLAYFAERRAAQFPSEAVAEFANEPVRPIAELGEIKDMRKVRLGFELYHDTRLSGDNTISCASCHDLSTGGVDNEQFSDGVGGAVGGVNAPTVYNAVYNFVQFWDGRANTLAEQAAGPPLNPVEMASESFDQIIAKLSQDKLYVEAFKTLYPEGITEQTITDAIEEFEKILLTPNSPFDKYLKGDSQAISDEAVAGYELFKQNNCATCHVGANLGGQSYELMGVKKDYFADRGTEITVEDGGRFKQTGLERDLHRFKVPGLRNVALTYPYFHDGTLNTMEEAVVAMAKYQLGKDLSAAEVENIVAFMHTLTADPLANEVVGRLISQK